MKDQENQNNLSKREIFAAMAMQGLLSNSVFIASAATPQNKHKFKEDLPAIAVAAADLLIKELKK